MDGNRLLRSLTLVRSHRGMFGPSVDPSILHDTEASLEPHAIIFIASNKPFSLNFLDILPEFFKIFESFSFFFTYTAKIKKKPISGIYFVGHLGYTLTLLVC